MNTKRTGSADTNTNRSTEVNSTQSTQQQRANRAAAAARRARRKEEMLVRDEREAEHQVTARFQGTAARSRPSVVRRAGQVVLHGWDKS